jgi:hypothetical protein
MLQPHWGDLWISWSTATPYETMHTATVVQTLFVPGAKPFSYRRCLSLRRQLEPDEHNESPRHVLLLWLNGKNLKRGETLYRTACCCWSCVLRDCVVLSSCCTDAEFCTTPYCPFIHTRLRTWYGPDIQSYGQLL